jgi:hypothetical protein
MHFRYLTFVGGLAIVLSLASGPVLAQSQPVNAKTGKTVSQTYKASRTVDGQPDLQGVWANNNATPLQRPKELEGRAYLTNDELAALKKAADQLFAGQSDAAFGDSVFEAALANVKGTQTGFKSRDGQTGDYSSVWTVERVWDNRTSLIVDPPDGRIPEMTATGKERANRPSYDEGAKNGRRPDSYEDIGLSVRCITFGSPRLGAGYNSYFQIAQSAKSVAIVMENIHDARMIPLDGGPHLPSNVKLWLGDSRGHWEGDTLVVDTTNYRAGAVMNNSEQLHVIERFTRTGPDVLDYKVTIDDPGIWTKPWTADIPLRHSKDAMYEYACHEGNYGLAGILAGARAEDAAEQQSTK